MRKLILITFVVLVAIVAVLAVVVAMQPADFRVERSATISAPPSAVFAEVNDIHNWQAWSPWEKIDPTMKRTYEGAPSGTGAIYKWSGNNEAGEGKMTITESRPYDLIKMQLEFVKPFAGTCSTVFVFKEEGDKTLVTWNMTGENNFIGKAIHVVMNMDKTVGGQFEQGLANLKTVVETKKHEGK